MKYLLIILSIVCAISVVTLISIWPDTVEESSDSVVSINGHPLSRKTIQEYKEKGLDHGTNEEFLDEIITRQLLIAEAQKLNIDKEISFRISLKNFYEHSLIKILMERKDQELKVEVEDSEIDDYLNAFGNTYTFYLLQSPGSDNSEVIIQKGTKNTALFNNLSQVLQKTLITLKEGESSVVFMTSNEKFGIHLDSIVTNQEKRKLPDRDLIKRQLYDAKKEAAIDNWIKGLRTQATITYHNNQE